MTTVVVTRKAGQVAIAADSLVTFGDTRLPHGYESNEKLFKIRDTFFGVCGTTAHFPVLRAALAALTPEQWKFNCRDQIFDTFLLLHAKLKDQFFLNTKEDESDPYESSQYTVMLANASGIYGVYSYREVFEFDRFWAIGSGRSFALGAMYAAYASAKSAREIAELGVRAGCEFDKSSDLPVKLHTLKIKSK